MTDRMKEASPKRRRSDDKGAPPAKSPEQERKDTLDRYTDEDQLRPQGRAGSPPQEPFTVEEAERRMPKPCR